MEIKEFAPIIIPTLNRYNHFKRCLESLERCSLADKTDVYVGLDYPPSDKHVEGWKKIDDYLVKKQKCNQFSHLYVFRRDHNCGVGKEGSNGDLLLCEVAKVSKVYIYSEDDNEFSPNFLEYINWGLQEFVTNDRIYAVCGYNGGEINVKESNVFAYTRFNAWGYGCWFNRREKVNKYRNFKVLETTAKQFPLSTIWKPDFMHAFHVLRMIHRREFYGDSLVGCIPQNERYCVYPAVSKVRNYGWDGSGLHGSKSAGDVNDAKNLEIDCAIHFEPNVRDDFFLPHHYSMHQITLKFPTDLWKFLLRRLAFILWRLTGINIC